MFCLFDYIDNITEDSTFNNKIFISVFLQDFFSHFEHTEFCSLHRRLLAIEARSDSEYAGDEPGAENAGDDPIGLYPDPGVLEL